jgi:hypothetical protein
VKNSDERRAAREVARTEFNRKTDKANEAETLTEYREGRRDAEQTVKDFRAQWG